MSTAQDGGNVVTFAERVVTTFNAKKSRGKADDAITLVNPAWHQVVSVYVVAPYRMLALSLFTLTPTQTTYPTPSTHLHPNSYRSETGMSKGSGSLIMQKIGRAFQTTLLPTGAIDALHTGLHDVRFGGLIV